MHAFKSWLAALLLVSASWANAATPAVADPLPSWRDGPTKAAIVTFVEKATRADGSDFIPVEARIATFDNDGTLWSEQPLYFQGLFIVDQIKAMAPDHPEWASTPPYQYILQGDMKALAASGEKGLMELLAVTHAGMDNDAFTASVQQWIKTSRHPTTGKPYTAMVFQPMLELLAYLRANQFKTYIVSGGGQEFMRAWVEPVYGIPPEQVIGSQGGLKYVVDGGVPSLQKTADIVLVDDHAGKPVGIQRGIGRRPVFAFGNSDGDLEMLQWTTSGKGLRFAGLVHHTDGDREWAYDRASSMGKLDKGLEMATQSHWTVVDMARDWTTIYPATP